MELLPMVFASGWASGVNAYATVFVLGVLGRFVTVGDVPEAFQRTDVLVVMGVLALVEFVADKVPVLDSLWDVPSSVIRPVAGALIGALVAGADGDLLTITLAAVGGVTALVSHLLKAGLRLGVNTSPEPASNLVASAAGDVGVVGVTTLAVLYPVVAALVALALLIVTAVLLRSIIGRVRRGVRWLRGRLGGSGDPPPQVREFG